jgi:DNA-binding FadR family transcriptional regulator
MRVSILVVSLAKSGHSMEKRARQIAEMLQQEIMAAGWPIGQSLGSEPELLARFGVGRGVLREAIRLLESRQVAEMRKGPSGGLVVSEPNGSAVATAMTLYMEYRHVTPVHLFETRRALELTCVEVASAHLDEEGIDRLRKALASEQAGAYRSALHLEIAALTGNPAFELFVDVLAQLTSMHAPDHARPEGDFAESDRAHAAIVEAMIAGDVAVAKHRMMRHIEAMSAALVEGPPLRRPRVAGAITDDEAGELSPELDKPALTAQITGSLRSPRPVPSSLQNTQRARP